MMFTFGLEPGLYDALLDDLKGKDRVAHDLALNKICEAAIPFIERIVDSDSSMTGFDKGDLRQEGMMEVISMLGKGTPGWDDGIGESGMPLRMEAQIRRSIQKFIARVAA